MSSFSPSIYTVKCIRSSSIHSSPADHPHLKMSANRMPSPPSLSHTCALKPLISISSIGTSSKFRVAEDNTLGIFLIVWTVHSLLGLFRTMLVLSSLRNFSTTDTGKSRGFAFVTMSAIEDCNAAIENLDGREFAGRTLRVNISDRPRTKVPLYLETEYKLFVGNLSWSATSESLTKAFQEYGTMVGARVLYDGETGRSRGYGFVCYSTKSDMDVALESLNGFELEGRALRVSLAEGKRS